VGVGAEVYCEMSGENDVATDWRRSEFTGTHCVYASSVIRGLVI